MVSANAVRLSQLDLERHGFVAFNMGFLTIREDETRSFDLADLRIADQTSACLFIIESQTDQAATVQPFGGQMENPGSDRQQYNIGPARALPAGEQVAIKVPLGDDSWFPFMGLSVTFALPPTRGNVHATAIYINKPERT